MNDPYRGLRARRPATQQELAWRDALIDRLAKQHGRSRAEVLATFEDVAQQMHMAIYAPAQSDAGPKATS